jgi:DNA-binding XRE family transcriptional regulator
MKISPNLADKAILQEVGERLAAVHIERKLTQAAVTEQAGVAKRTVERLESGELATRLSGFLRVCRVLGLLARFAALLPEPLPGPMPQLQQQCRKRQWATGEKAEPAEKKWPWGEPA